MKTGNTVKLIYDFMTHGVCEVKLPNGVWYRVTAKEFRSYDGPRRLTTITGPALRGRPFNEELSTYEYNGPVYLYETNIAVKPTACCQVRRTI